MLLKDILSKEFFNIPFLVKGYTNFKLFKEKKEFLIKVGIEDINNKDFYFTSYFQPEFSNLFPLRGTIHRGKIVKLEGEIEEIDINFNKTEYKKIKNINNYNILDLIENKFSFNENAYIAKYKNIIIPSHVIGQYFYFPNSSVRRIFRQNTLDSVAYEVDCEKGHILFKRHTKNENITAIFTYLFKCNEYFSEAFKDAYYKNIFYPLKEGLIFANADFRFPKIDKELKLKVRGEKINDIFIVYEILNLDFRQIIGLDKLEVSYLGNKTLRKSLKTNVIASKIPSNISNISNLESYSNIYQETIFDSSEFLINKENQIKIEKTSPKKFHYSLSKSIFKKEEKENDGISFGNFQNNNSKFSKGSIGISKNEIEILKNFIEKHFEVIICECKNLPDYAYIHFTLIFRDKTSREYLILKLNRPNSAWYIFSSSNIFKNCKSIIENMINIFDGKHQHYKSFNHYSRYLMKKYGICFHKSLKSKERESISNWLERLKERILEYDRCKGM